MNHPPWNSKRTSIHERLQIPLDRESGTVVGSDQPRMRGTELYEIYAKWTGELHFWCLRELDRHIDAEFFPGEYQFKVYSGWAQEDRIGGIGMTVPGLSRPDEERSETIQLLKPEDNPSEADLRALFKTICLAAARVLEVRIARAELQ